MVSIAMLLLSIIAFALLSGVFVIAIMSLGDAFRNRRQTHALLERIATEEPLYDQGMSVKEKLATLEAFLDKDDESRDGESHSKVNLPA